MSGNFYDHGTFCVVVTNIDDELWGAFKIMNANTHYSFCIYIQKYLCYSNLLTDTWLHGLDEFLKSGCLLDMRVTILYIASVESFYKLCF